MRMRRGRGGGRQQKCMLNRQEGAGGVGGCRQKGTGIPCRRRGQGEGRRQKRMGILCRRRGRGGGCQQKCMLNRQEGAGRAGEAGRSAWVSPTKAGVRVAGQWRAGIPYGEAGRKRERYG